MSFWIKRCNFSVYYLLWTTWLMKQKFFLLKIQASLLCSVWIKWNCSIACGVKGRLCWVCDFCPFCSTLNAKLWKRITQLVPGWVTVTDRLIVMDLKQRFFFFFNVYMELCSVIEVACLFLSVETGKRVWKDSEKLCTIGDSISMVGFYYCWIDYWPFIMSCAPTIPFCHLMCSACSFFTVVHDKKHCHCVQMQQLVVILCIYCSGYDNKDCPGQVT